MIFIEHNARHIQQSDQWRAQISFWVGLWSPQSVKLQRTYSFSNIQVVVSWSIHFECSVYSSFNDRAKGSLGLGYNLQSTGRNPRTDLPAHWVHVNGVGLLQAIPTVLLMQAVPRFQSMRHSRLFGPAGKCIAICICFSVLLLIKLSKARSEPWEYQQLTMDHFPATQTSRKSPSYKVTCSLF